MIRSTDRIKVTHQGTLPRPEDLRATVLDRAAGVPVDDAALTRRLREAIAENLRTQMQCGIDSVNDGELSKPGFSNYVRDRLSGLIDRDVKAGDPPRRAISARDAQEFGEYFQSRGGFGGQVLGDRRVVCVEPIKYTGHAAVQADLDNFKAALQGVAVEEAFLPAIAPGTIDHWLQNDYYKTTEEFLFAIADGVHEEYKAIVDAGFVLQIDDPDLPDGYNIYPEMSVQDYRKYAELRVEALNHALRGLPTDRVRFHMCWGSYKGPHKYDIPLGDIIDIVLKVNAGAYSIEQSNPRHEHEWRLWEEVKLPEGKTLIPGVIGHASDFIEHPELVAQRLVRYARLVGRENVVAGTDCGIGSRVGHAKVCWAKFQALAEGARIATKELWG